MKRPLAACLLAVVALVPIVLLAPGSGRDDPSGASSPTSDAYADDRELARIWRSQLESRLGEIYGPRSTLAEVSVLLDPSEREIKSETLDPSSALAVERAPAKSGEERGTTRYEASRTREHLRFVRPRLADLRVAIFADPQRCGLETGEGGMLSTTRAEQLRTELRDLACAVLPLQGSGADPSEVVRVHLRSLASPSADLSTTPAGPAWTAPDSLALAFAALLLSCAGMIAWVRRRDAERESPARDATANTCPLLDATSALQADLEPLAHLASEPNAENPLEVLASASPGELAALFADEQPRIAIALLRTLPPASAAAFLESLDDEAQRDWVARLARSTSAHRDSLQALTAAAAEKLEALRRSGRCVRREEGLRTLGRMFGAGSPELARKALDALAEQDAALAEEIREELFDLEDLTRLSTAGLRQWLSHVEITDVAQALENATPKLESFFAASLSPRLRERLNEERGALADVFDPVATQASERRLIQTLHELIEAGAIQLAIGAEAHA